MPKKIKSVEEHLQTIQYLLAGILMKRDVSIHQLCKVIGCTNTVLSSMYPQKKGKNAKTEE